MGPSTLPVAMTQSDWRRANTSWAHTREITSKILLQVYFLRQFNRRVAPYTWFWRGIQRLPRVKYTPSSGSLWFWSLQEKLLMNPTVLVKFAITFSQILVNVNNCLARLAYRSAHPARQCGRCSVRFAVDRLQFDSLVSYTVTPMTFKRNNYSLLLCLALSSKR